MNQVRKLIAHWQSSAAQWDEQEFLNSTQLAISIGDPKMGIDILQSFTGTWTQQTEANYLMALAQANAGSQNAVFKTLDRLLTSMTSTDKRYIDCLCLLGRLEKSKINTERNAYSGTDSLELARNAYQKAYTISEESYPGINLATLSYLLGRKNIAATIAARIITAGAVEQSPHWKVVTLAEAHLLREDFKAALEYYRAFIMQSLDDYAALAAARKNLNLLATKFSIPDEITSLFIPPNICVFSGHMYDGINRPATRFPFELGTITATEIGAQIDADNIRIGYCSAACGCDLLFAKEMLRRNLEVNIVLPFEPHEFLDVSVCRDGIDDSLDYWEVLEKASSVTIATQEAYLGNGCLFSYAADLVEGYARTRVQAIGGNLSFLAAIDPYESGLEGGSMPLVQQWMDEGFDVNIIDIAALRGEPMSRTLRQTPPQLADKRKMAQEIKTMVEVQLSSGSGDIEADESFLTSIGNQLPSGQTYLTSSGANRAFHTITDAIEYAFQLLDETQISKVKFKIALHTGPVLLRTGENTHNYYGLHVQQAKNLSALVTTGCIYLTEQAAMLMRVYGSASLNSDYIGIIRIKGLPHRIYQLHRH